jgi:hypothetical protein
VIDLTVSALVSRPTHFHRELPTRSRPSARLARREKSVVRSRKA